MVGGGVGHGGGSSSGEGSSGEAQDEERVTTVDATTEILKNG